MAKRSPILGYNHNFRHRGLVFHIQTEDSGVNNPHIFSHLFHGGVILSSRKLDYDAAAAEDVVKSLMQAQHRAVLKDLKRGTFDGKIEAYLGSHPDLEAPEAEAAAQIAAAEVTDSRRDSADLDQLVATAAVEMAGAKQAAARPPAARPAATSPINNVSDAFDAVRIPEEVEDDVSGGVAEIYSPAPASAPTPPGVRSQRAGAYSQHRRGAERVVPEPLPDQATEPVRRPAPPAPEKARPGGSGVVVSRPAVIVGAPPQVVGGNRQSRPRRAREDRADGLFGQDLISEKSLDEVILAYLSEDGSEE